MGDTTVVVVSYNTRELTLRAVAAARAAAPDATVLVADNGSSDGTVDAVRATFPNVEVLEHPDNPGYGAAVNRAVAARDATWLCALNADVELRPDTVRTLRRCLAARNECALVGPALVGPDGAAQPSCTRFPTLGVVVAEVFALGGLLARSRSIRRFYYADRDLTRPADVDTVSGAVMLIRGDAFRKLDGFDEGFRLYFEEVDLCRRLHDAGFRVAYCPDASAVHRHGASSIQTTARQVDYYLSAVRYFRKHHGRSASRVLAVAVAVATALRMVALVVKYPPLDRRRAGLLGAKLAACARLLRALPRAAGAIP